MPNFYFRGTTNNLWNTTTNWYTSAIGGVPYSQLPSDTDDVFLVVSAAVSGIQTINSLTSITGTGTGRAATSQIVLSSVELNPNLNLINVQSKTNLQQCDLINTSLNCPNGPIVFSGSGSKDTLCSYITGNVLVAGNKSFPNDTDTSYYLGLSTLYINGTLSLSGDTVVVGPLTSTGLITFYGNSYIDGNVSTSLYNLSSIGRSYQGTGYVSGTGYFINGFNNGYIDYGIISANNSTNSYVYGGNYNYYCLVLSNSATKPNVGTRVGDLTSSKPFFNILNSPIYDTKYNLITSLTFINNGSYGTFLGEVISTTNPYISSYTFLNNSSNKGYINLPCTFYNTSNNSGYIVVSPQNENAYSSAYFYNSSYNAFSGCITQTLTGRNYNNSLSAYSYFNDYSYNLGTIDYGIFNSSSSNIYNGLTSIASIYNNLSGSLSFNKTLTATNIIFSNPGLIYTSAYTLVTSIVLNGTSIYAAKYASACLNNYTFTTSSKLSGLVVSNKPVSFISSSGITANGVLIGTASVVGLNGAGVYNYGTVTNLIIDNSNNSSLQIYADGIVTDTVTIIDPVNVKNNTLTLSSNSGSQTFGITSPNYVDGNSNNSITNLYLSKKSYNVTPTPASTTIINLTCDNGSTLNTPFTGTAYFKNGSSNSSNSPSLTAYFYDSSLNTGTVYSSYYILPLSATFLNNGSTTNLYYYTTNGTLSVNGGVNWRMKNFPKNGYYLDLNGNPLTAINFYDTSSAGLSTISQLVNASTYPILSSQFTIASFYNNSYNNSTILAPATAYFYDSSRNYGIIDTGVFYNTSANTIAAIYSKANIKSSTTLRNKNNQPYPTKTTTWYYISATLPGSIKSTAYFYNSSYNCGNISSGTGYFYDYSSHELFEKNILNTPALILSGEKNFLLSASPLFVGNFFNNSYNNGIINTANFYNDSINNNATFNFILSSGYNYGDASDGTTTTTWTSIIATAFNNILSSATFNSSSYNKGTLTNPTLSCTFNDNSYNAGTVIGDVRINSSNNSIYSNNTIKGNVYFNNAQITNQTLTLTGNQIFNIDKGNGYGYLYNSFGQLLTSINLRDQSSYNVANFPNVSAILSFNFVGNSINNADLTNAKYATYSFNDSTFNNGKIYTATFNNSSFNSGTVTFAVFNSNYTFTSFNSGNVSTAFFNVQTTNTNQLILSGNQILITPISGKYYNNTTGAEITSIIFKDNSIFGYYKNVIDSQIKPNVFYFKDNSINKINSEYGSGYFSDSSINTGRLQNALFTNVASNSGAAYTVILQNSAVHFGKASVLILNDNTYNASNATYGVVSNNANSKGLYGTSLLSLPISSSNIITFSPTISYPQYMPGIINLNTLNVSAPLVWFEAQPTDISHNFWIPRYTKYTIPGYVVQLDLTNATVTVPNVINNYLSLTNGFLFLPTEKIYQNNKFIYPSGNSSRTYTVIFKNDGSTGKCILLGTGVHGSYTLGEFSLFVDFTNKLLGVDCYGGTIQTTNWNPNDWNVFTVVFDSKIGSVGAIQLYVNGIPTFVTKTGIKGLVNTIFSGTVGAYEMTIGARPTTTTEQFKGRVSGIIMYDRVLTPKEIYSIYLYYKNKHTILSYN